MRFNYPTLTEMQSTRGLMPAFRLLRKQLKASLPTQSKSATYRFFDKKSGSFFFDKVLYTDHVLFYKAGLQLDSLVKSLSVSFLRSLLSLALGVLDKFSVVFITKKLTETS